MVKRFLIALLLAITGSAGCVKEPNIEALELKQQPQAAPSPSNKSAAEIVVKDDGEITTATIAEGRNLQLYASGGHYKFDQFNPAFARRRDDDQAKRMLADFERGQNFIWQHWEQKQHAYLRLTFVGIDAATTQHIFIEPDVNGTWMVKRRLARWHALFSEQLDEAPKAYQIERKVSRNGEITLIFNDAGGKKIDTL